MSEPESKKRAITTLDSLKELTVVVADTGDFEAMKKYKPTDATTNPSLILAASAMENYKHIVDSAISEAQEAGGNLEQQVEMAMDIVYIKFGIEILKLIPGRVSTEVDARLSFDKDAMITKAKKLIKMYEKEGIDKERILIKLSSTWEGVEAARVLERDYGIHCNMTLLFNYHQAIACAQANATLVSPFVGRIYDWYVKNKGQSEFGMLDDPGVQSVTKIFNYFKKHGHKTVVMGASFRNTNQILGLAGCDYLTISPKLLESLSNSQEAVSSHLDADKALKMDIEEIHVTENDFRWAMNEDEMANDKLSEGIRKFAADSVKLENSFRELLAN